MKRLFGLCVFGAIVPLFAAGGDDPAERTPIRIRGSQKAPEFANIEAWLNSKPIAMSDLKGKVVVVHFMAFG